MPKRRLIPTLAILAASVAACFGAPNASPSEATGSPEVTAAATVTPTPHRTLGSSPDHSATPQPWITPPPGISCLSLDQVDLSKMEVSLASVDEQGNGGDQGILPGRATAFMDVTRVTELFRGQRSAVPPTHERPGSRGLVLGGHEFITFPSTWFDGHDNPQTMISASAELTLDGQAPRDLATRFVPGNENFDQVAVTVPDASGSATLAMTLVWADPCYRYEASTEIAVDVVPRAETVGCALEAQAYYDQLHALLDGSLEVSGTAVHAFSPRNEAKFFPEVNPGIDAFPLYAFDREEPAIIAAPGTTLTIAQASPEITLSDDMTLTVYTRASVAKAIQDYPPQGAVLVLSRTPARQADGTFRLRVPQETGRYVAVVTVSYDSHCSSGTLWFVANIDVVAPASAPTATPAT